MLRSTPSTARTAPISRLKTPPRIGKYFRNPITSKRDSGTSGHLGGSLIQVTGDHVAWCHLEVPGPASLHEIEHELGAVLRDFCERLQHDGRRTFCLDLGSDRG